MKIIRVFGVVVGVHLFALMLIFANPGCSSTGKPAPAPADTAITPAPEASVVTVPLSGAGSRSTLAAAPIGFDPSAPAVASVRFTPTRPGTPAASALEPAPIVDVTPATTYTLTKGDSLWTIANKNHLTISELAAANNISAGSKVHPGQKLIIPGKAPKAASAVTASAATATAKSASTATGAKAAGDSIQHTVKAGEVLSVIAKKYGVKQGDVAVANNITDPKTIRPGQILTIPGWQAPGAKTTAAKAPAKFNDATGKSAETAKPIFIIPPVEQDLDSGLKSAPASDVPVIKVEEAPKK
ncbi:MAG: LysM peptidoglycan-binding domain-containing protein [Undibacterium sp.]|nr:LysM peptidoglycan-binding domain-containing protein [Opitutaceae bacterium]